MYARTLLFSFLLFVAGLANTSAGSSSFTMAVIPDTQNYIDFRHQKAAGYKLDSSLLFKQQMEYLASRSERNGGDIAFVASVGDVWQHQTKSIDPQHLERGIGIENDPILARNAKRTEEVLSIELPTAFEGFQVISDAKIPFGVAPGNHDYDAAWSVAGYPPNRTKKFSELERSVKDFGLLHVGGFDNFRSVFGEDTHFFKDKSWYVASHKGGVNSAQKFSAGGYEFLHLALEMQPGDEVLAWAESVIENYPGLPTIITTHDYMNSAGKRVPYPLIDLVQADPDNHNNAEQLWSKLIDLHAQIFLVLCGHQRGQSVRIDKNSSGNLVYQILANYQDRGQAALEAGYDRSRAIGDGWLRLMHFELGTASPTITVRTFSTYYNKYSSELDAYPTWYKGKEQPHMSDEEFYSADDFVIDLVDFNARFGGKN